MEIIGEHLQKLMDNLRERPWIVFLTLSLAFGGTGWMFYREEVQEHKQTIKNDKVELLGAIRETKEAQQKTISYQEKLLQMKNDTAK